jgi:hypothetical protein
MRSENKSLDMVRMKEIKWTRLLWLSCTIFCGMLQLENGKTDLGEI